jgi:predicted ATPase/DNA-binding SARP family transcriptional activator
MSHLTISLLGPLQVSLAGQAIGGFAYNKARALLAYLVVEADRTHQRDTIVGLLWPEMTDVAARTNLRQVLTSLRDTIGSGDPAAPFLITTRDTLQFNPASDYTLDVTHFVALLEACAKHRHRHMSRCPACAARLEEAVQLYRGDFLAELSSVDSAPFEEWLVLKREALHQRAVEALTHLAHYHERWGDVPRARQLLTRLIELEPWDEMAHAHLMCLLAQAGQRSAALAQYETCRRMLVEQFGVKPSAATMKLYEQIREGISIEESTPPRSSELPIVTTKLIGRAVELAELSDLLSDPAHRLLTIVGPGGIGKTRLAVAASTANAPIFDDGVAFIPLAALNSADLLPATILSALGLTLEQQTNPERQLIDYLRARELLLVLDSFEHLLATVELVSRIIQQAPKVALLITSRERLALQAEQVFELAGLDYPVSEAPEEIACYQAVQLFVERAQRLQRKFQLAPDNAAAVARICRLVEGLPLAIELAASTVSVQSCAAIADDIANDLRALATRLRDVPERHRSMWAAFEHSWRLLTGDEQTVFSCLSVFRGGFQLEAAQHIAGASAAQLAALIDKSLVQRGAAGRYDLHELLSHYGHEKLIGLGEIEQAQERHLTWFMQFAAEAEAQLMGKEQAKWLEQLEVENDNLRAALQWSLERGLFDRAAQLAAALWRFWWTRGYLSEGRQWYSRIVAHREALSTGMSVKLFNQAAVLAAQQGDFDEAQRLFEANLALNRELGNMSGTANVLNNLGALAIEQAQYDQARAFLEESLPLRRQLGNQAHIAATLNNLGTVALCQADLASAQQYFDESLTLYRKLEDTRSIAGVLNNLGGITLERGELPQAQAFYRESLLLRQAVGDKAGVAECLEGLAAVAVRQAQPSRSLQLYGAAAVVRENIGAPLPPTNATMNEQYANEAQAQLGRAAGSEAFAAGRALSFEDAIALALSPLHA